MTIIVDVSDVPTFTSYTGLKEALIDFLDGRGQNRVAEFIGYAEDYLRLTLDVTDRETSFTATTSPIDLVNVKRVVTVSADTIGGLRQVSLTDLQDNYSGAGCPQVYAIFGEQILIGPSASGYTYRINYLEELPRLSEAQQSNWLLQRNPSLYLYAALCHAEVYLRDSGWISRFWDFVNTNIALLNEEANEKRWAGPLKPTLGCVP